MHETQGTTRDRKELLAEWNGRRFLLIDTGGVDIADPSPITRQIVEQAREAIEQADLVLFVVDARIGVTPGDEELAQILRESKKDVLLIANKIDDPSQESLALELHRLGFGDPFPLSGLHGSNTGDLLDEVLDRLPGTSDRTCSGRRNPRRHSRTAERRQVVAPQQAARKRSARSSTTCPARRGTRPTRCSSTTAARSCSSTPPVCAANEGSVRASTTTRSCARSTPPIEPTSPSS